MTLVLLDAQESKEKVDRQEKVAPQDLKGQRVIADQLDPRALKVTRAAAVHVVPLVSTVSLVTREIPELVAQQAPRVIEVKLAQLVPLDWMVLLALPAPLVSLDLPVRWGPPVLQDNPDLMELLDQRARKGLLDNVCVNMDIKCSRTFPDPQDLLFNYLKCLLMFPLFLFKCGEEEEEAM